MTADGHHHGHGHVHIDEEHWRAWAAHAELDGEVLLPFVTDTASWLLEQRGPDAPPVRSVLDIGSGPGVGACELARCFPDAHVTAVDSSPAMLERAELRAAERGLASRIGTHAAELPGGLDGFDPVDVIWASLSLHHMGDEVASLRVLRDLLGPDGLMAIAELAEPMRVLPDELGVGRPGFADRLDRAATEWFGSMREGLPDAVVSADLTSMVSSAGLEVVGDRVVRQQFDAPLSGDARRLAIDHLHRARHQFEDHLDEDDLRTFDVLLDADDPRGVTHRTDLFVAASRQIVIARPTDGG